MYTMFYRVKLAINEDTNTAVAVKIIPTGEDDGRCSEEVRKEVRNQLVVKVNHSLL